MREENARANVRRYGYHIYERVGTLQLYRLLLSYSSRPSRVTAEPSRQDTPGHGELFVVAFGLLPPIIHASFLDDCFHARLVAADSSARRHEGLLFPLGAMHRPRRFQPLLHCVAALESPPPTAVLDAAGHACLHFHADANAR